MLSCLLSFSLTPLHTPIPLSFFLCQMNSLDALMSVCHMLGRDDALTRLAPYEPDKFAEPLGPGTVADLGYLPILHMRHFQ
ncbi:unnamed protein product, partial [Closterium sp. NIES-54]